MNWYYIDGPRRVGPVNETDWAELVRTGTIRPETLVWHEGMENHWLPFSQIQLPPPVPENEPWEEPAGEEETLEAYTTRVADLDYTINFRHCVSRAWETFKAAFWPLVGVTFLIGACIALGSKLPILDYLVPMFFHGVFMGGLYSYYLRTMRNEPVAISDLFAGFSAPLLMQLGLKTLATSLVTVLCFLPASIATAALGIIPPDFERAMASSDPQARIQAFTSFMDVLAANPEKTLVWLLVFLACSIPAVYFSFCWMFSIPLIVDKRMAFWPAMQLSRRKVLQHPWRVSLLIILAGLIGFSGILGFFICILFTIPLYSLISLYLYEDMFNPGPK